MLARPIMVSTSIESTESHEEQALLLKINQLKRQIQAERIDSIKDKLVKNGEKLLSHISQVLLKTVTKAGPFLEENKANKMLFSRIQNPLCKFTGFSQGLGEKEIVNGQDVLVSMSIKLPKIENIPSYTTWIFLDRNQRMADNQSVVGRRRIYYDQHGSEALICSDSEEEIPEPEEEKYEFCEGEDRIIWMAFEEHGTRDEVVDLVSHFIGGTTIEIQERYSVLKDKHQRKQDQKGSIGIRAEKNILQDRRSLGSALDPFDNLFCRRCLVFDCHLHGCSQNVINPSEKKSSLSEFEEDGKPCSDHCYLRPRADKKLLQGLVDNASRILESTPLKERARRTPLSNSEEGCGNTSMETLPDQICLTKKVASVASKPGGGSEVNDEVSKLGTSSNAMPRRESLGKRKDLNQTNMTLQKSPAFTEDSLGKKPKLLLASNVVASEVITLLECVTSAKNQQPLDKNKHKIKESIGYSQKDAGSVSCDEIGANDDDEEINVSNLQKKNESSCSDEQEFQQSKKWKPIEKDLYLKGVEIFGKNSCLIAKNLLSGLKTCTEVSCYMDDGGAASVHRSSLAPSAYLEDEGKAGAENMEQELRAKSRLFRKRGRTKKLKYSWKSAGLPSVWKRIADGKNQSCKQYTPCGCQSMCGKKCSCLHNGTCCEKYCGCSKSCKNRFRGCHCGKSQCRSRQCPCFAAGRECDPDVCKNCWVSCGDYTLSEPPRRGDGQCGNMRLLLRQQQKILLAKSDVAGWGAFIKNSVNKNDYLGEYTGELISHKEADKRGKIYDRANSSFLFDLNDQYVLDAYRKGDKLKFANHSSNPNCYAKVMFVAGDHRVGIFAKEHIEASEELFYDYRYDPDQAPAWARKPDGSKRDESTTSHGRAKKHQSHY